MAQRKESKRLPVQSDPETGELYVDSPDTIEKELFSRAIDQEMMSLADFTDWSPTETRLLVLLMALADAGNLIHHTPGELRQHLGVNNPQMCRAVAALIEKDIVVKCRYHSRSFYFMLNPAMIRKFKPEMLGFYIGEYESAKQIMLEKEGRDQLIDGSKVVSIRRKSKQSMKRMRAIARGSKESGAEPVA
ncbi:helix-turn-helix domain-containing protein [Synechococcus elongatus]|uniref:helix-turn-helix domain-containing protein n=1 Tax=Synechococcus elongatus TaxID=32046 RepID=UPI0030CD7718